MGSEVLNTFSEKRDYLAATVALLRLMKNKEDTTQPFLFFDATCGPQTERNFERYLTSPEGQKRIAERFDLAAALSDRARLGALPAGTLGRTYFEFMRAEGLTAEGFMEIEAEADISGLRLEPVRRHFLETGFHLHDIFHVMLGYGRDFVGEACILAFTATQQRLNPILTLAYSMGIKEKLVYRGLPVFDCIREAEAIGKSAKWTLEADWRRLLTTDLTAVREELNIQLPTVYPEYEPIFSRVDEERREKLAQTVAA